MAKYFRKPAVVEVLYLDAVGVTAEQLIEFTQGKYISINHNFGYDPEISIQTEDASLDMQVGDYLVKDEIGRLSVYKPEDFRLIFEEVKGNE